jgi:hypothetical protein
MSEQMESHQWLIDALKNLDHMCEAPRKYERKGGLVLNKSPLGTRVAWPCNPELKLAWYVQITNVKSVTNHSFASSFNV